jgi:hypothetical protein
VLISGVAISEDAICADLASSNVSGTATFEATAIISSARGHFRCRGTAVLTGLATCVASPVPNNINRSTIQATAALVSAPNLVYRATATATGVSTLISFRGTVGGTATIEATASVIASARLRRRGTAMIQATSSLVITGSVRIRSVHATLTGVAAASAYSEIFQVATVNPALSGDLVDVADPADLRLYVDGNLIDLSSTPYYNLNEMRFSYDGKYLTFSEIATPTLGHPTWNVEQPVQLDINFGAGFKTYFKGKIKSRGHQGSNHNESIDYEASGYQIVSNDYTVLNTLGHPDLVFTVGSTVTSDEEVVPITKTIANAIQDLFNLSAPGLNTLGIPATIGVPGLTAFTGFLPESVQLRNVGFYAALQTLASYEPGVRAFFDDTTQTWIFVKLTHQPTMLTYVESVNLQNLNYQQDVNDCYTAVKLYADVSNEHILNHSDQNSSGYAGRVSVSLQKDWNAELEATWDIFRGEGADDPEGPEGGYWWVYRRYKIPDGVVPRELTTPKKVRYKVDIEEMTEDGSIVVTGSKWVVAQAYVNIQRRLVVTHMPIIKRGNPYVRGEVKGLVNTPTELGSPVQGADEVVLTYWPLGAFKYTFVTSTHSDGTVATTAGTYTTDGYATYLRYPEVGYRGTAYDFFGIERELVQVVDPTEVTSENARALLEAHKDVRISSDLPIEGDPLESAINLQKKLRVMHGALQTGLQSVSAHLTGFRYQFGKRGLNTLSLSTDISGLVKI